MHTKTTSEKYRNGGAQGTLPDFKDDMRNRAWRRYTVAWLREGLRVSKDGAVLFVFSDHRQLPDTMDAVEMAGWKYRGVTVWDKLNGCPQLKRPKQDGEFIIFASKGKLPFDREWGHEKNTMPGVLRYMVPNGAKRNHITEKPLGLMRDLVKVATPGGLILDPFVGSGTTAVAAREEGYSCVGIEIMPEIAAIAERRIQEAS